MKVLFLDIDGVVNKRENFNPAGGRTPYPIDRHCAFLVGKIQLDTDCKVVMSSSWRNLPEALKSVNDTVVPIHDVTPNRSGVRGSEVKAWLDEHPEVTHYAILDDDADFYDYQPLFKTTFVDGLTEEIAKQVTDYLNDSAPKGTKGNE